jgi:replication factor C subunit 1
MEFSDDESAPWKPATSLKRKKPAALMSSESEEDLKAPPLAKGAAVAVSVSKPSLDKSGTTKPKSKSPPVDTTKRPKKARRVQNYESTSEDDGEDDLLPTKEAIRRNERGKPPAKSGGTSKGTVAPGSKDIPEPASPDCLAGLSFVFTGELSSLSRNEAVDLAKKYGGCAANVLAG